MQTIKEMIQQIQTITYDACKSSGQTAALLKAQGGPPETMACRTCLRQKRRYTAQPFQNADQTFLRQIALPSAKSDCAICTRLIPG